MQTCNKITLLFKSTNKKEPTTEVGLFHLSIVHKRFTKKKTYMDRERVYPQRVGRNINNNNNATTNNNFANNIAQQLNTDSQQQQKQGIQPLPNTIVDADASIQGVDIFKEKASSGWQNNYQIDNARYSIDINDVLQIPHGVTNIMGRTKPVYCVMYHSKNKYISSMNIPSNNRNINEVYLRCSNGSSCVASLFIITTNDIEIDKIYLSISVMKQLGYSFIGMTPYPIISIVPFPVTSSFNPRNSNAYNFPSLSKANSLLLKVVILDSTHSIGLSSSSSISEEKKYQLKSFINTNIQSIVLKQGSYFELEIHQDVNISQDDNNTSVGGNGGTIVSKTMSMFVNPFASSAVIARLGFHVLSVSSENKNEVASSANINNNIGYFRFDNTRTFLEIESLPIDKSDVYVNLYPKSELFPVVGIYTEIYKTLYQYIVLPLKQTELFKQVKIQPSKGIIVHGPPGSGKTQIIKSVTSRANLKMISIYPSDITNNMGRIDVTMLESIFSNALSQRPCVIFIDEIDGIFGANSSFNSASASQNTGSLSKSSVLSQFLQIIDGPKYFQNEGMIIVAATNQINSLDSSIRRAGRFDKEIVIPLPDAPTRELILKNHFSNIRNNISLSNLNDLSNDTSGFSPADLSLLVKESFNIAIDRQLPSIYQDTERGILPSRQRVSKLAIEIEDVNNALSKIIPSSLRNDSSAVRTDTKWKDIAGSEMLKTTFRKILVEPLRNRSLYQRFHPLSSSPKGVLMFGPPGNGKTLAASAVANESGYNFLAIKSTEIFNKLVGESERRIRDIFETARNASPCIIFFDEIDAITMRRSSSSSESNQDIVGSRILVSLLNEMDSVEKKADVIVIGATNRIDVIDTAMLRPGRFDIIMYVGMPSFVPRCLIINNIFSSIESCKDILINEPGIDFLQKHQSNDKIVYESFSFTPGQVYSPIFEAARLTEGCSNADIREMCREAVSITIERIINNSISNPREMRMSADDLITAAKKVRRSISPQELQSYENMRIKYNL